MKTNSNGTTLKFDDWIAMRYHFTIGYRSGFDQVADWLRRRAAEDPRLALGEGQHGEFYVVVASSEELARWAQEQLDADRLLPEGMGVLEVSTEFHTVRVNLECGDDEAAVTAMLIKDLLNQFPNYGIFDEDRDEEITEHVRANVDVLFGS